MNSMDASLDGLDHTYHLWRGIEPCLVVSTALRNGGGDSLCLERLRLAGRLALVGGGRHLIRRVDLLTVYLFHYEVDVRKNEFNMNILTKSLHCIDLGSYRCLLWTLRGILQWGWSLLTRRKILARETSYA